MEPRIVKPTAGTSGRTLQITPESAGWTYVGFEVVHLSPGQSAFTAETGDREVCLVILSGKADVATQQDSWSAIGQRMSVFDRIPPYAVYVPAHDNYAVTAVTELAFAICTAPGSGRYPARLISPDQIKQSTRGSGATERYIHDILPEQEPAESLLVVEVYTPGGHWSSYPPHKHDRDALPAESLLEETYYFRIQPEQGFAVQRVYTDDRTTDATLCVSNGEAVLVPKGYHPVGLPPGYDGYYLNVMAGPKRNWTFHNDPAHAWLMT